MIQPWAYLAISVLLTACGGGGGASNSNTSSFSSNATKVLNQSVLKNTVENYAVGDLNRDGLDDVVIGGWTGAGSSYLSILIQNANGSLTDRTVQLAGTNHYSGSQRIFILDVDNDGFVDIWLPGFNDCTGCSAQSVMLWGSVTGNFTQQTFPLALDSHGSCVADLNGDGRQDFLVRGVWDGTTNNYGYYLNNGGTKLKQH